MHRHPRRGDHQQHRTHARDADVMPLGGIAPQEAAIEIGNQIRRAPVQLRRDGRHERRQESRHRDAAILMRQMRVQHHHVSGLGMLQPRIEDDDRQPGDDPRPRTNRVMRDVEPQHRQQSLLLITRAEDALRDVAATTGLRSRIPEGPPLQSEIHQEVRDRHHPQSLGGNAARKLRQEAQRIGGVRSRTSLDVPQTFHHRRSCRRRPRPRNSRPR